MASKNAEVNQIYQILVIGAENHKVFIVSEEFG